MYANMHICELELLEGHQGGFLAREYFRRHDLKGRNVDSWGSSTQRRSVTVDIGHYDRSSTKDDI
jgi:hypothetical protein